MERRVKRGVAIYSYSGEYGRTMNLEDCFKDLRDMGATGIEILANSHIDSYPALTDEYVAEWMRLCTAYGVEPVEYGHWIDSRLYRNREISPEEAREKLVNDFQIAHRLGFRVLRTKMGVINAELAPMKNWREIIKSVLPEAEKYDVVMCPEIHLTTVLSDRFVQDYVDFINETGTRNFGLNIDLSVFQNRFDVPGVVVFNPDCKHSQPNPPVALRQVHSRQVQQNGRRFPRTDHSLPRNSENSGGLRLGRVSAQRVRGGKEGRARVRLTGTA